MSDTYNLYNLEAPFEEYLLAGNQKPVSIKNYLSDIRHFFGWLILYFKSHKIHIESEAAITQFITIKVISEYRSYLSENNIPHKTINRRLSTIRKFCSFCISQGWMKENPAKKIGNIRHPQGVLESSIKAHPEGVKASESPELLSFPRRRESKLKLLFKNAINRLYPRRSLSPNGGGDDKQQPKENLFSNSFSLQHYIGLIIILIFVSVMGAGIYNQFFVKSRQLLAYPTTPTFPGVTAGTVRMLSFQGRLTDSLSNPITTATNVVFQLYSVSSGGTALYTTGTCSVTPDQDGIFSSLIGSTCGSGIDASIFSENANIYLGVTVGADAEMTPRQQIANVGYAINAETLQGLPPGSAVSTVPYINSQGNLLIAASNPSLASTYASSTFTISSAQAATIQSAGTGDIVLQATESGTLKFRTGGATDANTRITVDNVGLVGIGDTTPLATLTVGNGDLFQVAGATGNVLTSGTMTAATNETINGIDISSGTVSDVVNLTINTGGDLTVGAIGLNDVGTTNITSGASLVGAFDEFDNSASTTVQDVLDDLDAAITTGGGSSMWSLASGVIYPTTVTNDLAIGGTTLAASMFGIDESAGNFYLGYDNSANPTLNFEATDADAGEFGFNTNDSFYFSNANVGIGTTAPDKLLSVWGGDGSIWDPTDLGTESLTNGALTAGTSWTQTADCALSSDAATCTFAAGTASTVQQASGTLAVAGVGSRWYKFVYTVSGITGTPAASITTAFASSSTALTLTAGTQTTYFKSATTPTDFIITTTLTAGQAFTLDTFSLKEVQGGDLALGGILTGGGTTGLKVLANGNVGIGDTSPAALLTVGSGDLFQVDSSGNTTLASGANLNLTAATDLIFGGATSLAETTGPTDSGAYMVGANDDFTNSTSTNVQGVLKDFDTAIATGGGSSMWTLASGVIYPTTATNDFAIGGSTLAASMFGIDESAGNFYLGYDNSANPTLNFEATDADAGEFGFNTNDAFYFSNANVGIGVTSPAAKLDILATLTPTYSSGLKVIAGNDSTYSTPVARYGIYVDNQSDDCCSQYGIYAKSDGNNSASNTTYGVYGEAGTSSTGGNNVGVYGKAAASYNRTAWGVYGNVANSSAYDAYGGYFSVSGAALTNANTIAILGNLAYTSPGADARILDLRSNNTTVFMVGGTGNVTIANQGDIRLSEPTGAGTNYVGLQAPDTLAGDTVYKLPNAFPGGASGYYLTSNTTGDMSWSNSISASSLKWNSLIAPDGDLSPFSMGAYNTVFNWDPGADTTETNFTLTTQGEDDSGVGGDTDQVLLALSQTDNGVNVTEAADALLTLGNSDADDPVDSGIRFSGTYNAEIAFRNGEILRNNTDKILTVGLSDPGWSLSEGSFFISGDLELDDQLIIDGLNETLADSSSAEKTFFTVNSGVTTLTGPTTVTSLMETAKITGATIAASTGTTVNSATALSLVAPIDSTNATITDDSALRILNVTSGAGTLTNQYGIYIDSLTAGAASNYAIYTAGTTQSYFGGNTTLGANANLTLTSGTGQYSQTYTGTANASSITSSSTTDLNKALNISQTGATTGTDYGLYLANTGTGTTNVGGYFSASGATNNYGLIVENGNVGIGTTAPGQKFTVGYTDTSNNPVSAGAFSPTFSPSSDPVSTVYPAALIANPTYNTTTATTNIGFITGLRSFLTVSNSDAPDIRQLDLYNSNTGSGTITNAYNIYIRATNNSGGGGITNNYGLYVANQTAGTNNYSIYTGTAQSYFGGNVGIGDTTPDYLLDVAGAAGFDSTLTLTGSAANIALGSNYLSGDGGDEGVFVDSTGSVGIGTNSLTYKLEVQDSGAPQARFTTTAAAATGAYISLFQNSASPANADNVGRIYFQGNNSAPTAVSYSSILSTIVDVTSTSEDANIEFYNLYGGTSNLAAYIDSAGTVYADVGTGTFSPYYSYNFIPADKNKSDFEYGDVIKLKPSTNKEIDFTNTNNDPLSYGVVHPPEGYGSIPEEFKDIVMGDDSEAANLDNYPVVPVAHLGTAITKVYLKPGEKINTGDPISSSEITRYGKKSTQVGTIIGKSSQQFDPDTLSCTSIPNIESVVWPNDPSKTNNNKPCFTLPDGSHIGKVMIFVNVSWYDPSIYLTSTGNLEIKNNSETPYVYDGNPDIQNQILKIKDPTFAKASVGKQIYNVKTKTGEIITRIGAFSEVITGKIKAGLIETENAIVSNVLIAQNIIAENISSKKMISPVVETENITATGTAKLNEVQTNEIRPEDQELAIDLSHETNNTNESNGELAKLIIKGLEGKTVTTIDAAGNASFSGQVAAQSLSINSDATISGTLVADELQTNDASISGKLIAKEIESDNLNSLTREFVNSQTDINEIQSLLADIQNQPLPDPNNYQNLSDQQFNNVTMEQLTVTGNSNLYNVSVSNSLLVGTTLFENNSIVSLASELRLSALSTINLLDGAVIIAKDGTITTQGELIAEGGIRTDTIKPLTDDGQVTINNLAVNNLTINNISTNSAVIAASDNFAQNGIFAPAIETATSSAGIAILPENSSEIIVYNNNIKENSLVYLTPISPAAPSSPITIAEKIFSAPKPYFKVLINTPSITPIKFNWLIVN